MQLGGYGSGRRYGYAKRTTRGLIALDINWLHRNGNLMPGRRSSVAWSRGEKPAGSIGIRVEEGVLVLDYRWQGKSDEWETVTEYVLLSRTACNYGGYRSWFICPGVINGVPCQRRVAKLYAAGKYFLCRHCYNLAYQSQRESKPDRSLRKAQNIRMRLGGTGNISERFPFKPKWMHYNTYDRLRLRAENAEGHYLRKLDEWLMSVKPIIDEQKSPIN
jgi:hypothetical protein